MSHALLLRLFLSPYFSVSLAMQYLKTYPDNIGISHYLCWRMKKMPPEEVEFYWPQICHLLLTYPTQSNALESFILSRAEESTHSAMLTFWFMQAALRDLTPSRITNPRPFMICQRILHKCHEIIFGDPPEPSRSPYRSLPQSPSMSPSSSSRGLALTASSANSAGGIGKSSTSGAAVRVNNHIPPALVGMGVILASTPGMGGLVELAGDWAITQGRRPRDDIGVNASGRSMVQVDQSGGADLSSPNRWNKRSNTNGAEEEEGNSEEDEDTNQTQAASTIKRSLSPLPHSQHPQSMIHLQNSHSSTTPNLSSSSRSPSPNPLAAKGRPRKGSDPFGQLPQPQTISGPSKPLSHTHTPPKSTHQPFYSVPELPVSRSANSNRLYPLDRPPPPEAILATYSVDAQRQLLRSHYCRSEVRFLLLLEDISNRLLVIPKPARVSALRAELTSLNHNLPAEVCMPLWCAADHGHEKGGETSAGHPLKSRPGGDRVRSKAHARVVRISPGDSVVLNSAERAPYLIHVEILEGDLDFDPTRRENRDLLKKIVVQEDMKRRKLNHPDPTSMRGVMTPGTPDLTSSNGLALGFGGNDGPAFGSPMPASVPRIESSEEELELSRTDITPDEIEEMDLVEQLYGAKLSVHDTIPDLSESVPLPSAPKNKQLDMVAWEKGSGSEFPSRRSSLGGNAALRSIPSSPNLNQEGSQPPAKRAITLEDYSERMRTAAVMLAQLNASLVSPTQDTSNGPQPNQGSSSWIPGTGWIIGKPPTTTSTSEGPKTEAAGGKLKLAAAQAAAIRERIMEEMMALEEERVARMTDRPEGVEVATTSREDGKNDSADGSGNGQTAEDEGIVRRELNKADPSAAVFKESWTAKKSRIRASSPWGHLANWDVISVIVKTGADLRQEQLATQLIERFSRIWKDEKCECWVRFFRILITGETSGLVETITDAVSVHSIKKGEYAKRLAEGGVIGHVSLKDHYVNTYGKPDSGRYLRAQRNFIRSLAGYSIVTYLLQIKDRHNGNILVDHDGHLIHIDFGFMLSNSPGNMGFEAAPFKMPLEYVDIMGGLDSPGYLYFKKLFKEGFEAARKHSDSLITIVELMEKNSKLDCFALFGEQTSTHFRERFQLGLTTQAVDSYLERLIVSSTGSNYTRLYDTFQYYRWV
uniref:1-phosphatidylinositol 4-kinase n=1 Tax=Kwoniella bestiolae CBS 10118 TaxID=1296100 RepID=A0A1B9FYV6_9TREE|nr:Atypical/PI4K protein kinase [Kwoniella bestiolae CBS 10118]OCF23944.1 Atypical/PI4K protein kinase [Kwoniella bestiolae CBS 10118]